MEHEVGLIVELVGEFWAGSIEWLSDRRPLVAVAVFVSPVLLLVMIVLVVAGS